MKKKSKTDWARIDQMSDEDIDTSDIPPLDTLISYCRPFSTRYDLDEKRESKLDESIVEVLTEEEEIEMHARIKQLRDESYGHSDARSRLFPRMDYTKDFCVLKGKLNLSRCEVDLLKKMILKWIKYLDKQISLTKPSAFLIAPASEK